MINTIWALLRPCSNLSLNCLLKYSLILNSSSLTWGNVKKQSNIFKQKKIKENLRHLKLHADMQIIFNKYTFSNRCNLYLCLSPSLKFLCPQFVRPVTMGNHSVTRNRKQPRFTLLSEKDLLICKNYFKHIYQTLLKPGVALQILF